MDIQPTSLRSFKNAYGLFLKDLQALPDEAFGKRFGDKTRTVADIVFEVNLVNDHVGMVIRNEEPFVWPDGAWITAPEGFDTKEVVIEAFKTSSDRIVSTIEAFSEEDMVSPILNDGQETTRFARCQFMTLHLWYHSGQLNFIQTLIGDDGWHWNG